MNCFKFLLPSFLLSVLTGCSSISYEEPKSGPVARVRFVTDSNFIVNIYGYKPETCDEESYMMTLRNGFRFRTDAKRLGIPLWDYNENAGKEFLIPAGLPQIFSFRTIALQQTGLYTFIERSCFSVIHQNFEEGKDYELSHHYEYHSNRPFCSINLFEIKTNEKGISEKVPLQRQGSTLKPDLPKQCDATFGDMIWK
jgi:hypothetical protein